ncbi:MAG: DNA polymerase III subunit alpha, partial [Clostridia bacterium]|nr:DNA polymerase III subunit alpha [Clostridia bacterium]
RMRFETDQFYLKSAEEMEELFDWCPEAISSTVEIANKCNFTFKTKIDVHFIPPYTNEEMGIRTTEQFLCDLANEKLKERYDVITPEIQERMDYELSVINECGFSSYFLIVWDFINAARKKGISIGPGRGSGVGSIVAYSIGITQVDPLKYNLIFERFLSKERVSMPDFDIDICCLRRQEVVDYVERKYGKENVSKIIAYSTMATKAAIKDVARAFEVPYQTVNDWMKMIPLGNKIADCLDEKNGVPEFIKLYRENPDAKKVIDEAKKLEGMPRQVSTHAAGVVICSEPVVEHVPLQRNKEDITTQFDKTQVEALGLLKMDFLGLVTLTDIAEALKYIKADKGVDIDFSKIEYDDPEVFKIISGGDCEAVFQLESGGMKKFMSKLKPDCLEEIIAGISLFRPGPIQYLDQYIEGKLDPDGVKYAHPLLKEILGVTYGCIVYQEQVMQIARSLAGFSFGGADVMRRAMSKKKVDILLKMKSLFIEGGDMATDKGSVNVPGAVKNGVPAEVASDLFDQILKFSQYAFNKSHAAAYSVLSYRTAYLKCYYPLHFLVAVANNRINKSDELKHYIGYMKQKGFKFLSPDINRSEQFFTIENGCVRFGLMGIKNVGSTALDEIINERNNYGKYRDMRDFASRNSFVNKRMLENLIKGGAFDCFGQTRATMLASYTKIIDIVLSERKHKDTDQLSFFDDGLIEDVPITYDVLPEYDKKKFLAYEKEVLGMYISGHPLEEYTRELRKYSFDTSMIYAKEDAIEFEDEEILSNDVIDEPTEEEGEKIMLNMEFSNTRVKFGGIFTEIEKKISRAGTSSFFVGQIEDLTGALNFAIYAPACDKFSEFLQTENPVEIQGKLDLRDEREPKIIIEKIAILTQMTTSNKDGNPDDVLWVLLEDKNQKSLVESVLSMYPGNTIVKAQIVVKGSKDRVEQFNSIVTITDELMFRLRNILGEKNIKTVSKRKTN